MQRVRKLLKDPLFIGIMIGLFLMGISFYYLALVKDMNTLIRFENIESAFKLMFAAIAGSIIGFERENKNRPAGLRTHSLVCIGATIAMIIPIEIFGLHQQITSFDMTRMGAQVISGVGFLGAGTIIRNGASVKGLTTAASLWVVSIIGLAIGAGLYVTGIVSTVIVFFILKTFGRFEYRNMTKTRIIELTITTLDITNQIKNIHSMIQIHQLQLVKMEIIMDEDNELEMSQMMKIRMIIRSQGERDFQDLFDELQDLDHIIQVETIN